MPSHDTPRLGMKPDSPGRAQVKIDHCQVDQQPRAQVLNFQSVLSRAQPVCVEQDSPTIRRVRGGVRLGERLRRGRVEHDRVVGPGRAACPQQGDARS